MDRRYMIYPNRGSAVIEATLALPLFLFFVIALYHMGQERITENRIYEAAVETAEYMAEYAYLDGHNVLLPELRFRDYIDDETLPERYVEGGIDGISFLGTILLDEQGYVILRVRYRINMLVPFFPPFPKQCAFTIRQKAYVGMDVSFGSAEDQNDVYVYITDNRDVYHSSRNCTYLRLSVHVCLIDMAEKNGYTACEFCGKDAGKYVYVTDFGKRYHSGNNCSGLKRSVYRVKIKEVEDMEGCSRCVK